MRLEFGHPPVKSAPTVGLVGQQQQHRCGPGGNVNLAIHQCHLRHPYRHRLRRQHPLLSTNSQLNGSTQDKPAVTTTYSATASGPGGNSSPQQVQVAVAAQPKLPTLVFSANSNSIVKGDTVTLSWQLTDATSIAITAVGADGVTRQISTATNPATDQPAENTTYTAVATGPGGSTPPQTVSVAVVLGAPQITQFAASPTTVVAGASSTIHVANQQRHFCDLLPCASSGRPG